MWKTILIVAAVVIGIGIAAAISWFMVNPDGFVDTIMGMEGDFHVRISDTSREISFTEYRDDATSQDRVFLMKKWVLLHVMTRQDETLTPKRDEFGQAIFDAAADHILDGQEVKQLRAMHADIVTPDMIKHWLKTLRKYDGDPDEQ